VSEQFESRLEEARDMMKDLALPPGYHLGHDPDGNLMVIKDSTSEIFAVEGTEEHLPQLVIDLWRDYISEAPPAAVCRLVHCMTAVDAVLSWEGELSGGPRNRVAGANYRCSLWGKSGDEDHAVLGWDDDPVEAVLKARRTLLESYEPEPELGHDPDDELDEELHEPQEG